MPACPMCAEPITAGAAKCASCGEALVDRPPAPKADGLPILAIVVIFVVLAAGGCLLTAIALPGLAPSPRPGNEAAAIGALRTFNACQTIFREGDKDGDGTLDYGTLSELSAASLVDPILGGGVKQGYTFQVAPSPTTPELLWMAVASPTVPGTTGDRYFVTNQAGIVYYSNTTPFTLTADCAIPAGALPAGR